MDPIVEWLKLAEMDQLKNIVKDVTHQFNRKLTPKPLQMMQTDDRQATSADKTSVVRQSHRIEPKTTYSIHRKSAGIVLIINQVKFHFEPDPMFKDYLPKKELGKRDGTNADRDALKKTFSTFGYDVRIETNRLHTQIPDDIRSVVKDSGRYDSVIVCILSHGCNGMVYGANSVPVKIDDIEKIMLSERLIGKPKVLIVQACQGDKTHIAKEVLNCRSVDSKPKKRTGNDFVFFVFVFTDRFSYL